MKIIIKHFNFLFIILLLSIITACFGDVNSPETEFTPDGQINFNAKLGSSYTASGLKIVAVPVIGLRSTSRFGEDTFEIEVPVESDGSISVNLNKKLTLTSGVFPDGSTQIDTDYVLMVVNETKPVKDRIVSFISMSDLNVASKIGLGGLGSIESIVKIPVSVSTENIDAGTLTQSDDEAKSTNSTGGDFSLNINQLKMIAQSDDVAKTVKNDFLNPDLETKISYLWDDVTITTDFTMLTDFSDPVNFNFSGCSISFWEMPWSVTKLGVIDDIITGDTKLGLYPPSSINSGTYDLDKPVTNNMVPLQNNGDSFGEISNSDFYAKIEDSHDESRLTCNFGGYPGIKSLPEGEWILRKQTGGTAISVSSPVIGSYDFAAGNPFADKSNPLTSVIKVYVPSIKLTITDGNITGIDIKWYLWNGTVYADITDDLSMMNRDEYETGLSIRDASRNDIGGLDDIPVEKTSCTIADFKDGQPIPLADVKSIRMSLNNGPFSYDYSW